MWEEHLIYIFYTGLIFILDNSFNEKKKSIQNISHILISILNKNEILKKIFPNQNFRFVIHLKSIFSIFSRRKRVFLQYYLILSIFVYSVLLLILHKFCRWMYYLLVLMEFFEPKTKLLIIIL